MHKQLLENTRNITSYWTKETGTWDKTTNTYTARKVSSITTKLIQVELIFNDDGTEIVQFYGGPTGYESYRLQDMFSSLNKPKTDNYCICGGTINSWARCWVSTHDLGEIITHIQNEKISREITAKEHKNYQEAQMPKVLNISDLPGRNIGPGQVYIGRRSAYGNPHVLSKNHTPEQRITSIKQFLAGILKNPELMEKVKTELRGQDLICFCAPKPCHGDILLALANDLPVPAYLLAKNEEPKPATPQTSLRITSFREENNFLSNFYTPPYPLMIPLNSPDDEWATVEHYYQALKSTNPEYQKKVQATDARGAKALSKTIVARTNWTAIKMGVMHIALMAKFCPNRNGEMVKRLLATSPAILIEGNKWHDNTWGSCYCERCINLGGQNLLGVMLMQIRASLLFNEQVQNMIVKKQQNIATEIFDNSPLQTGDEQHPDDVDDEIPF